MVENEIPFLRQSEFRRMAPAILRLEITRLSGLISGCLTDTEYCNALVKARYELIRFVACLELAEEATLEADCGSHLRSALLALSMEPDDLDEEALRTRRYIIDRIKYVYDRMELVY